MGRREQEGECVVWRQRLNKFWRPPSGGNESQPQLNLSQADRSDYF
jgi:hypothetical protein